MNIIHIFLRMNLSFGTSFLLCFDAAEDTVSGTLLHERVIMYSKILDEITDSEINTVDIAKGASY